MLTNVQKHGTKHDQSKPSIKNATEIHHCHRNIDQSGRNRKEDVVQQIINAVSASVHDSQYFAGFSAQVPSQRKAVQMSEELYLKITIINTKIKTLKVMALASISLVVYCEILIHKNDLKLFKSPMPPVPPPCMNLKAT